MTYEYNTRNKRILRKIVPMLTLFVMVAVGMWWTNRSPDMSQPWTPSPHPQRQFAHGSPEFFNISPEILALESEHIARVRLLRVAEEVRHPGPSEPYAVIMKFEFEVIEWLKGGSRARIITGGVGIAQAQGDSAEEARWKAQYYFDRRDSRFDDREAVVFFQRASEIGLNHYSIGWIESPFGYSPGTWQRWLPSADTDVVSGASGERKFLWDVVRSSSSDVSGTSSNDGVSLNQLRRLAGMNNRELEERNRSVMGYAVVDESPPAEMDLDHFAAISNTGGTDNWVELVWSNLGTADSGVEGYRILRRKQSDANFIELASVPADTLTGHYEDRRDIQPETKYIYRLRAYGKNGGIADARVAITTVAALDPLDAPTATPTTVPTSTPTLAPAATATQTVTPTATPEATATPAPDILGSDTPTPTATATIEPTLTATPEPPPSGGVTGQIDTPTPTHTPEPTPTATYEPPPPGGVSGQGDDAPTPTPTSTATSTPEAAPTHTPTPAP